MGDVEFKYLFLKEINLEFCRGCGDCMAKGEEFCAIKDDAPAIKKEILSSDGVIFVSPVYINQVTGF
ncbi:MAG: NAD(P)H-dependent oxidoreductase [Candidatus Thermoplasmatota archaeon]|nr:NAD(P)H-dependent oxidoreductase [Candidatus Thermoplasmatota archaeon]